MRSLFAIVVCVAAVGCIVGDLLLEAVGNTLSPIHASVWLRETPR